MSQQRDPSARGHGGMFERFVHSEVSGSIVLLVCTIVALAWANSPWADSYFELAHTYIGVSWGEASLKLSLQHWVNDALMVILFFVVGLEIKREIVIGRLSSLDQAILPVRLGRPRHGGRRRGGDAGPRPGLAVSAVAGVGFTMSLFISELAFSDHQLVSEAKVGILVASLLAGVCGFVALHRTLPREAVEGG